MRIFARLLFILGCCVPIAVHAATQATVQAGERILTVAIDGPRARIDVSGVQQGYLLLHDARLYSVMRVGGQPVVMDAKAAAGMLGGLSFKPPARMIASLTELKSTGAHQTVAGRKGEVYTVSYRDLEGHVRTEKGVLGEQADVRELTQALLEIARLLQPSTQIPAKGVSQVEQTLEDRKLGLLSLGSEFRVKSLTADALPEGYLDLPAAPKQLSDQLNQWMQRLSK
ncbi:MAG TPA: hypothetical protein VL024_06885 [Castellaniella sp.]|nr:hypothetical protein [Castellaniella sp.]